MSGWLPPGTTDKDIDDAINDPDEAEHALVREYEHWCRDENLPCISAEELLHEDITRKQRQWLTDFIQRWDMALGVFVAVTELPMRRVIVESPYAGDIERNLRYARAALRDCLQRGEAPFASHLLYTQAGILRDHEPVERDRGIRAGFAWRDVADATVVYTDLGITEGMQAGIDHAMLGEQPVEYRSLGNWDRRDP